MVVLFVFKWYNLVYITNYELQGQKHPKASTRRSEGRHACLGAMLEHAIFPGGRIAAHEDGPRLQQRLDPNGSKDHFGLFFFFFAALPPEAAGEPSKRPPGLSHRLYR